MPFDPKTLGKCNKTDCACGIAFVDGKDEADYKPIDNCGVCGDPIGMHVQFSAPATTTTTAGNAEAVKPKTQTNKVDPTTFGGATAETLFGVREKPKNDSDTPSFHSSGSWKKTDAPFRDFSKTREENRNKAAAAQGISVPKFDPSEKITVDKLANRTGRPPVSRKSKKVDPAAKPKAAPPKKPATVILIPETKAAHQEEIRRPSRASSLSRYEALGRPENKYVRSIEVTEDSTGRDMAGIIFSTFENVLPTSSTSPPELFHMMDVVGNGRGAPSILIPNEWVQQGAGSYADIKGVNSKYHPSGMKPEEVVFPIYICLAKQHDDLPFVEPTIFKGPKSAKRTRSSIDEDEKEAKRQKPDSKVDEQAMDDTDDPIPVPPMPTIDHKVLEFPKSLQQAQRYVLNTCFPADKPRGFANGYGASGRWTTLALAPPYDAFPIQTGRAQNLLELLKLSDMTASLACKMLCNDFSHILAFAPFTELHAWLEGAPLGHDLKPEDSPLFMDKFRLGPMGMSLVVEALLLMFGVIKRISEMPGLSDSEFQDLRDRHTELSDFAQVMVNLMDFFFENVERRFWYPKTGFRQLEAVVAINTPLLKDLPTAGALSPIDTGLTRLRKLLADDTSTVVVIRAHLESFLGSAEDPSRMTIDIVSLGKYGLDKLLDILRCYVEDRPIHKHYEACMALLGKLAGAVAWKVFHYLSHPQHYNHPPSATARGRKMKRNPATGTFHPEELGLDFDDELPPMPDSPDSEWYLMLIIPNLSSQRSTAWKDSTASSPEPSKPSQNVASSVDPRLLNARELAGATMSKDSLLRRLRVEFPHPDMATRQRFETAILDPEDKKQYFAAQRAYHPDKNRSSGSIWVEICTQLNCAINKAFGK
ncbi:hypothetical protein BDZ89DRAFT_1035446 [Hymenopellis radicata]|nr:hypothetical protein BDZ89DRAFT_1035446 [Hymenopellis radicata]